MKKIAARVLFSVLLISSTLSARNYFSPFTNALSRDSQAKCLSHVGEHPVVSSFEMMEVGFEMPLSIDAAIENTPRTINPFDPEQINVIAFFSNGTITDTVYGFYYEDFTRDASVIRAVFENCPNAKWIPEPTAYKWRVRYSPHASGNWTVSIKVHLGTNPNVVHSIDPLTFTVRDSDNQGFLAIGKDKRHFIESNRMRSFFCLGQDIAWPDGERFRGGANTSYPNLIAGGYMDVQDWTENLAQNRGNMIRVVNVPWSYELEWDTVGVYNMAHAWELDSLFAVCERGHVKMVFCLEHGTYTLPAWHEEHLTWEKHPYHKYLPNVAMPEDFLTDSVARKHYRNKLRYFLARWGYSTSLGIVQLISEMEHWTLREPNTDLKNNKSAQRKFLAWHDEMLAFMKQQVPYRTLLTSTSYGAPPRDYAINAFSSRYCDVVSPRHCYFTQRNDNIYRFNEVNNDGLFEKGIHGMFPDKPAIFDETGFGAYVADPNDIDACNDVTYHNTLWATSFMGTAGSGLYWWRWGSNAYREQNFPALAFFFHLVDFESTWYTRPGHWEDASRTSKVRIETFYETTAEQARWHCIGWVHNASYWWGNLSQDCKDRNGKSTAIYSKTGDDTELSAPQQLREGAYFEVHDLAPQNRYRIMWYYTRKPGVAGEEIVRTNIFGTAKIPWREGAADWAFEMVRLFQ